MAKRHRRLGTILGALGLALVMTGPASAALTPRLSASTSPAGSAVSYSQAATDDPVAKITYYVPSGFTALLAQPAGEVVGSVSATALAADLGNATLPLRGTIVAADATTTVTVSGQQVPLSAAATQCTGTATHGGVLDPQPDRLRSDAAGAGVRRRRAAHRAAVRHREQHDPDLPAAAGRARGHAGPCDVRREARLGHVHLRGVQRPAGLVHVARCGHAVHAGPRARRTPAGTVEAQSVDRTPQQVTIAGRAVKGKVRTVRVTGRVRAAESGVAGVRVQVLLGTRVLGRATTRAGGVWTTTVRLPTATALLRASATAAATSAGACTASFPPVPCAGKTFGGFVALSPRVRVRG